MNIFKRLAWVFIRKTAPPGNTPREPPSGGGVARRAISWIIGDYSLRNSELLFAAVSRISNALSAMPIQLYHGSEADYSNINDILAHEPNPNMTSVQFFKTLEACRCTYGNAYALKVLDTLGKVERIDILDPNTVTPMMSQDTGELWYKIKPDKGDAYLVHNYYVIHVPFISTNGYTGINPVSVLTNTLQYNSEIQKFSREQLENGLNAQVVLEAPAQLGKEQRKKMLDEFREVYFETHGGIMLLESGVIAKPLNLSPVDAKIFEVEKISRSRVAMVYNIPPHLLGDYSDTSFASQEQQALEFQTATMLPIVAAYEAELNRKMLTRVQRSQGYSFKFNMETILRADAKTRAEVYQVLLRGGAVMPNEVRRDYGRPSDPSGDTLFVSRDLVPLKTALLAQNTTNQPNQGGKTNE